MGRPLAHRLFSERIEDRGSERGEAAEPKPEAGVTSFQNKAHRRSLVGRRL
jgi:chorismate-pyruvate lyase